MDEIRLMLDLYEADLTTGLSKKRILKRFSLISTKEMESVILASV